MGHPAKQDRRSQRTRQLLSNALTELMQAQAYDKITVQDIIARANVGRSTFYAHYDGKDSLLIANFEWLLGALDHAWGEAGRPDAIFPLAEFFQHVRQQRPLYEAMASGRGLEVLFGPGSAVISRNIEKRLARLAGERTPTVPLAVLGNCAAGAVLVLLRWWVEKKMPYSPKEMDAQFHAALTPGLWAALGGPPTPTRAETKSA